MAHNFFLATPPILINNTIKTTTMASQPLRKPLQPLQSSGDPYQHPPMPGPSYQQSPGAGSSYQHPQATIKPDKHTQPSNNLSQDPQVSDPSYRTLPAPTSDTANKTSQATGDSCLYPISILVQQVREATMQNSFIGPSQPPKEIPILSIFINHEAFIRSVLLERPDLVPCDQNEQVLAEKMSNDLYRNLGFFLMPSTVETDHAIVYYMQQSFICLREWTEVLSVRKEFQTIGVWAMRHSFNRILDAGIHMDVLVEFMRYWFSCLEVTNDGYLLRKARVVINMNVPFGKDETYKIIHDGFKRNINEGPSLQAVRESFAYRKR